MKTYYPIILVLLWIVLALTQTPRFSGQEYFFADGDTLRVNYFSAPYVYDWDGDNDKDLLVGQFVYGNILFYENIGTHLEPVFDAPIYLQADDSIITLPFT